MSRRRKCPNVSLLQNLLGLAVTDNEVKTIEASLVELQRLIREGVVNPAQALEILQGVLTNAATKGHSGVIRLLVQRGHDLCHSSLITKNNAFVLLLSAGLSSHVEALSTLVHCGADVNCADQQGESLLHKLCFYQVPQVVDLLINFGARIDQVNSKGETCLFPACQQLSPEVTSILLQKGAKPNHLSASMLTPLHVAAKYDRLGNAQVLMEHGAVWTEDLHGRSPITQAALCKAEKTLHFFLTQPSVLRLEKVHALELAGAAFAPENPQKTRMYLTKAMQERNRDPDEILRKPEHAPATELDNMAESQTLRQLQEVSGSYLQKESFLAAERILGTEHPDLGILLYRLVYSAYKERRWNDALALWRHGRKPLIWLNLAAHFDNRLLAIFEGMRLQGRQPSFKDFHHALQLRVVEMEHQSQAGAERAPSHLHLFKYNIYLLYGARGSILSEDDHEQLMGTTSRLVKVLPAFTQSSVLHHAIQNTEWSDAGRSVFVSLMKHLVQSGADVNAADEKGNTALHLLVQRPLDCDLQVFNKTARISAEMLLEYGAHLNAKNKEDLTPVDLATTEEIKTFLMLVCVERENIEYKGIVPPRLDFFRKIHSQRK